MVTFLAAGVAALLQGGAKADSVAPGSNSSNTGSPVTVSDTNSDVNNTPGQNSGSSSVTVEQSSTSSVSGSSPSISSGGGTPPSSDAAPSADTKAGTIGNNQDQTGGLSNGTSGSLTDKLGTGQQTAPPGDQSQPASDGSNPAVAVAQPATNQSTWTPPASDDSAIARPMVMTQAGSDPAADPAPAGSSNTPAKQPADKLPLSDGGFFSAWLKPLLVTPSGSDGGRATAVYSLLSVLRAPVKVLAILMLVSTFFLLWLRRSGYSHAARSDMVAFNFATPKRRVTVGVFAVGNSYFCGVRNTNLTNVWQERR